MSYNDNVLSHYGIEKAAGKGDTFSRQIQEAKAEVMDSFLDELVGAFKFVASGQIERGFKVKRQGNKVTLTGRTFGQVSNSAAPDIEADDIHIQVWMMGNDMRTISNLLRSGKKKDSKFGFLSMSANQVASQCFFEHFHGLVK